MIKSEVYRGQIYSGSTSLESTIKVEQTAPMRLVVRAGKFTTTGDIARGILPQTFELKQDAVCNLTADPSLPTFYKAELGVLNGAVDVLMRSRLDDYPPAPNGWQKINDLIFEFVVPPGTGKLDDIDIFVLSVLPGFPKGTTEKDWKMQSGWT